MTQLPQSKKNQNPCKLTTKRLILLNDDYNTFDHVIDCLVSLCDHETVQA